jgi:hypothetical protein
LKQENTEHLLKVLHGMGQNIQTTTAVLAQSGYAKQGCQTGKPD